jgi:hypothetical protein
MTSPDADDVGTAFPDTSWEAHRLRRATQGLDLTPAERLHWLESTLSVMREWLGCARSGEWIRGGVTARVVRSGEAPLPEESWPGSPEERLNAVWMLTRAAGAWTTKETGEPRLQRSTVRVQRARG